MFSSSSQSKSGCSSLGSLFVLGTISLTTTRNWYQIVRRFLSHRFSRSRGSVSHSHSGRYSQRLFERKYDDGKIKTENFLAQMLLQIKPSCFLDTILHLFCERLSSCSDPSLRYFLGRQLTRRQQNGHISQLVRLV